MLRRVAQVVCQYLLPELLRFEGIDAMFISLWARVNCNRFGVFDVARSDTVVNPFN